MTNCDIAIIGAGPYGLSIAAHLKARGLNFRIFGSPMHTWLTQMPRGMRLKSEGFASFLYDPAATFTLAEYCKEQGIPYQDVGLPVPLETFAAYGLEFQKRFVPELENKLIVSVQQKPAGFEVRLEDGESVTAQKLIVAVGISHFAYVPPILSALPPEYVSHSSKHSALDQFKGRAITVVGAGASALDLAALLHQAGAAVQVVARKPKIRFHDPPETTSPTFWQRLRNPLTGIGPGWKLYFYANLPLIFHRMPERFRFDAVRRILGPAPGWFIRDQVVGKVPFNLGVEITEAVVLNGRVSLQLTDGAGSRKTLVTDHVIAATGYRVDLRRLTFLDADLQKNIRSIDQTPVLSSNFESSLPGLYFVGTSAANSFGPVLRFAYGAGFTARHISRHLARMGSRRSVRAVAAPNVEALDRG
ncbi:MAG: NAD(P)-binding domain-containing protein [Candidatus Acidiferrales bacterium]